jgi:uncharacterized RmlC-like cupin family protein
MKKGIPKDFITHFTPVTDSSKPGRVLHQVKVGDIYMSRLIMDPGVTTGNYYHKVNRLMFYVGRGTVEAHFEHVHTKEKKVLRMRPGKDVIHVPAYVALTTVNKGKDEAVCIYFSNHPLRNEGDCYAYELV